MDFSLTLLLQKVKKEDKKEDKKTNMPAVVKANKDFQQTQIKNVVIDSVTTDPTTPVAGQIWFRSDSGTISYYDGSKVVRMAQEQSTSDELMALMLALG